MNGLHTRTTLHRARSDQSGTVKPIDRIIAALCVAGLAILVAIDVYMRWSA